MIRHQDHPTRCRDQVRALHHDRAVEDAKHEAEKQLSEVVSASARSAGPRAGTHLDEEIRDSRLRRREPSTSRIRVGHLDRPRWISRDERCSHAGDAVQAVSDGAEEGTRDASPCSQIQLTLQLELAGSGADGDNECSTTGLESRERGFRCRRQTPDRESSPARLRARP